MAEETKSNKTRIILNVIVVVLICVVVIGAISVIISLVNSYTPTYDDGATVTLTKSDNGETTVLEGEDNVITPDQIELEFTYKDLQEYEMYGNAVSKMPSTGSPKILVLPIQIPGFELTTSEQAQTLEDINNVFFGEASDTYWESLTSFYNKSSFEKLNIEGDVMQWYDATLAGLSSSSDLGVNISVMQLITSALNYHISTGNVNVDDYDTDGDGFIDGLWVIYSAPDYQMISSLNEDVYWAYTGWWYGNGTSHYSVYAWASLYQIYHNVSSNNYANKTFSSWELDAHTLIHETGHVLGLNDYYDYYGQSCPAGCVDMMDLNVIDHNMYSKMVLGWVKPYIVIGDCSIELASNQYENSLVLVLDNVKSALTDNGDGTYTFNPFSEYMMVEYYVPEGLNEHDSNTMYTNGVRGMTGEGFRVYHIDNRLFVVSGSTLTEYTGQRYSSLYYFISNSTGGSYGETGMLEYYGLTLRNGTTINDYFAEVSLISDNPLYNLTGAYTYEQAYIVLGMVNPATTSDLFGSGSVFNISSYSQYFVYGSEGKFNNGNTFNSNIVFS